MTKALKHAPHGHALFAVERAGMRRWRWAIWESRTDLERDHTTVSVLRAREPFAGGVAYSKEEALGLVTAHAPHAIQISRWYATPGHLHSVYAYRDRLMEEAAAAGEEPDVYARRLDEERSRGYARRLDQEQGRQAETPMDRKPANVISILEWSRKAKREIQKTSVAPPNGGTVIDAGPALDRLIVKWRRQLAATRAEHRARELLRRASRLRSL